MICKPMKTLLKCTCIQDDGLQLGGGFGRPADRQKVIVVNLRYFSV